MKRSRLPAVLGLVALLAGAAHAQELPLEKILNPVSDYDPFESPPSAPPKFFPDEVDRRARAMMIDALLQNRDGLADHARFLKAEEARRRQQGIPSTGLADHALDLDNNTIEDRERYLAAQKEAARAAATPERRKYLEAIVSHDDAVQSERLMRQSATNFWGGMFNRMLSSVDLVGVASGNYVGAAAETTVAQLYALLDRDMPVEERRALARDLDHLKRYPDDPRNAVIRKQVEALDKKKRAALTRKQMEKAKEALAKGDAEKALFYVEMGSYIEPGSKQFEEIRQKATKALEDREQARKAALAAGKEAQAGSEQQADVRQLLEALSLRDSNQIQRLAIDLEKKYHGKPLAEDARDAEAVALEMKGWREAAKKILERIASTSPDPEARNHATALLQSPEYNLLAPFQSARTERKLQSVRYVLLGDDFLRKNLLFAAGAAAAGPAVVTALGMVNAMMVTNNFYQVMTSNPVSAQPVIDAGVAYVRNHPDAENATDVYKVLAEAFEERGMYPKAIDYHQLAGSPKEKIDSLKERSARAYLAAAEKTQARGAREYYLTQAVDMNPDSTAAAEAIRKLAAMAKDENQGMRMSKKFLLEHPELFGPRGLGLKSSLFDGDARNMEIADRGVNLLGDNELLVYYQTPWGVRSQSYPLPKQTADRFFVTAREKNLQVALSDVNQRAKDSVGGIKNLPAAVVNAERERRAARVEEARDDATFTLIREAGDAGGNHRRVLDAELVTENERDPGSKYKLPPIQGSISPSRFSMTGTVPTGLWGSQLAIGGDSRSPYGGVQIPMPLLEGFIPVNFMIQGRPGGVSLYPRIHTGAVSGADPELYR